MPVRPSYGERLQQVVGERGPLCVGIDPHPSLLQAWGLEPDVRGLESCARGLVEALAGEVAVFKPQSAFYERFGAQGVAVLEEAVGRIRAAGALVLLDARRGDIGSTMDAYARAYLGDGPLAADAVTLSPYLGFGSLDGAIELAAEHGRGVYVLALTSNPEGREFQHARTTDNRLVGQVVVDEAAARNPGPGPGHVGIVAGATIGPTGVDFSRLNGSILAPGIGAQGGTAADLLAVFGSAVDLVLPTTSRAVMAAGPDPTAIRDAARGTVAAMRAVLTVG
jgi:orotidine-5'-phosphate decarboxylase